MSEREAGGVVSIAERQPHMTIETPSAVHVLPASLLRDVIAGRQPLVALPDDALRAMLGDYLSMFEV